MHLIRAAVYKYLKVERSGRKLWSGGTIHVRGETWPSMFSMNPQCTLQSATRCSASVHRTLLTHFPDRPVRDSQPVPLPVRHACAGSHGTEHKPLLLLSSLSYRPPGSWDMALAHETRRLSSSRLARAKLCKLARAQSADCCKSRRLRKQTQHGSALFASLSCSMRCCPHARTSHCACSRIPLADTYRSL